MVGNRDLPIDEGVRILAEKVGLGVLRFEVWIISNLESQISYLRNYFS
jgi:hypothetical protein